jgi:hypothetical protein
MNDYQLFAFGFCWIVACLVFFAIAAVTPLDTKGKK